MDAVGEGLPRIPCARVPNAVTLEPEEVTAPERFALVVTFAAFPPMLSVVVETQVLAPARKERICPGVGMPKRVEVAAAYVRPELPAIRPVRVPLIMGLVKVWVLAQVFDVVVPKAMEISGAVPPEERMG